MANLSFNSSGNTTISDEVNAQEWGFWLKIFTTPVIVCIGIFGNTLSLVVMKSEALRHKSYSHYLCALSVFDTLTLIIRLIGTVDEYHVQYLAVPGLFHNFSHATCKLYNFLSHVITLMSAWIVVFMAVERLVAVWFPFKKVLLRTQSGAAILICTLLLLVCISQSFRFLMIENVVYDDIYNIRDCLAAYDYISLYTGLEVYYYSWTLVFVFPVIIVLVCNSAVLYQIFKVRSEFNKEANSRVNRAVRTKNRSTLMLLVVTFAYIITLLPMFLLSFIIDITIKTKSNEIAGWTYLTLWPYLNLSECIALLNYAMNFFIYVVSGRSFRFELRRKFNHVHPRRLTRSITGRSRSTREECLRLQ